jgi:predicted Zn-dependent protease
MMSNQVISNTGLVTSLSFSREQERVSDKTALKTLMALYGNVAGADQLFKLLQEAEGSMKMPEFFSTHPLSEKRIQNIHTFTTEITAGTTNKNTTPLPNKFRTWLKLKDSDQ